MLATVVKKVFGSSIIKVGSQSIDFSGEWKVVSFRELLINDCGIDINAFANTESLLDRIKEEGIELHSETPIEQISKGNLIDLLYKKVSRPKIISPTFLTEHPTSLSPLARANDNNKEIVDRFQLIINGAEVINAYSELVDPVEQKKRLLEQAMAKANGDEEAMTMDYDYITAMEYGMPPISGWGMGVDRFLQVITGQDNLRDTVLFPIMRPLSN
jgi:lysyl-tRNA synthetase class 2